MLQRAKKNRWMKYSDGSVTVLAILGIAVAVTYVGMVWAFCWFISVPEETDTPQTVG